MSADNQQASSRRQNWLRGEGAIACFAVGAALLLLSAMGGSVWWSLRAQSRSLQIKHDEQVAAEGQLLAQGVESMLSAGELSAARSLIISTAHELHLSTCRLVLPDGGVLADIEPRHITARVLPASWPQTSANSLPAADGDVESAFLHTYPIALPGHGSVQLEIAGGSVNAIPSASDLSTGVGAVGVVMLVVLLWMFRRLRVQLAPVSAVRNALRAAAAGDESSERLRIDPALGAEAVAWNRLLGGVKQQKVQSAVGAAFERRTDRRTGGGELDAAFDVMSSGLVVVDGQMRVKFANGAASVYLKTPRDQMVGREAKDVVGDPKVAAAVESVASGATQGLMTVELAQAGESGNAVLRFSVRPVRKSDGAAAMIIIEDLTQQRVAEAARNSFVAQVAHELRTPLTNIRLYLETALEDGQQDPAMIATTLNVISQESRRLERIVGEMLSVSEIEAGAMRVNRGDVRLDALFAEMQTDFQQQADSRKIVLEFSLPPKLPVLQGDRDKIGLALHNLVGNAIKYTPNGGRVTVVPEVRDGQLVVEVTDTGIGIKPEEHELIFEKFYRAKDEKVARISGTGLGLTLAREVARLHGGDITCQSTPDQGSTFTVSLPLGSNET